MEAYAQVLNYAIPFFLVLILLEAYVGWRRGVQVNRGTDTIASLSSGVTNTLKDVLGLTFVIISYSWLVDHIALTHIKATWLVYVIGFLALDLAGYWMHRWSHTINFLWNRHLIHHSSEEFNLACALRQSISVVFSFFNLLLIPAALLGVPAKVIAVIAPLHLFAQFWYHTRLIDRMGWLESFLVTPSHHRVHHAMNRIYIDKNYGQIFIFWDKWFGTFQPELADEPPVYGITKPVATWNPFLISLRHIGQLWRDAWRTRSIRDKVRIWFMPTGWRPADVQEKYPIRYIENVHDFTKYETHPSQALLVWTWVQLVLTLGVMLYVFSHIAVIGAAGLLSYGLFLGVWVFSYTSLLDRARYALAAEVVKVVFGAGLLYWQWGGGGPEVLSPALTYAVGGYLLVSLAVVGYFYQRECIGTHTAPLSTPAVEPRKIASH